MEIPKLEEPPLPLNIAIVCNIKKQGKDGSKNEDEAEYDSIDTINALKKVIESDHHNVTIVEANERMQDDLKRYRIDLAFNIAEGKNSRGREGQAPAILSMEGIPYSGSDETTLCVALDKALTKRILSTYNILSPRYLLVNAKTNLNKIKLRFPVIVKPNAEGSSKGILDTCIAKTLPELQALLKKNFELYNQEMLVEEYIEGREFTVGLLGNGADTVVFPPMEIAYRKPTYENFHVYSYTVKQEYEKYVDYKCPSDIDIKIQNKMKKISLKVYQALGCKDLSRIDFRVSEDGEIYFIEINPLPGLAPNYSDYPMLAEKSGVPYEKIVKSVLNAAIKRYGLGARK